MTKCRIYRQGLRESVKKVTVQIVLYTRRRLRKKKMVGRTTRAERDKEKLGRIKYETGRTGSRLIEKKEEGIQVKNLEVRRLW